jgi:hypothetical protein
MEINNYSCVHWPAGERTTSPLGDGGLPVIVEGMMRLAELIGTLSLAIDAGTGLPDHHAPPATASPATAAPPSRPRFASAGNSWRRSFETGLDAPACIC